MSNINFSFTIKNVCFHNDKKYIEFIVISKIILIVKDKSDRQLTADCVNNLENLTNTFLKKIEILTTENIGHVTTNQLLSPEFEIRNNKFMMSGLNTN